MHRYRAGSPTISLIAMIVKMSPHDLKKKIVYNTHLSIFIKLFWYSILFHSAIQHLWNTYNEGGTRAILLCWLSLASCQLWETKHSLVLSVFSLASSMPGTCSRSSVNICYCLLLKYISKCNGHLYKVQRQQEKEYLSVPGEIERKYLSIRHEKEWEFRIQVS